MGLHRKNKRKRNKRHPRASGQARVELVLAVVETDNTFVQIIDEDGSKLWCGKCIHCNSNVVVSVSGKTSATLEHIRPLTAGGTEDLENLALAHPECNNEKGIRHDRWVGNGGRADEITNALLIKRRSRWRERQQNAAPHYTV